jgi:hypothetical protein
MKKVKHKRMAPKKAKKRLSVVIDRKLDSLSNTILFKKKLEKANRILSDSGVPA